MLTCVTVPSADALCATSGFLTPRMNRTSPALTLSPRFHGDFPTSPRTCVALCVAVPSGGVGVGQKPLRVPLDLSMSVVGGSLVCDCAGLEGGDDGPRLGSHLRRRLTVARAVRNDLPGLQGVALHAPDAGLVER